MPSSLHSHFGPVPIGRQQRHDEPRRPIAASLGLPQAHIAEIDQSHERCVALGLSRVERPDHSPLGRADLTLSRDRNQRLYTHAAPVMEMLYEQIVNSDSMVVLCDTTGTVIHSIGDMGFLERAAKVALAPGANWSEAAKGTNAVGTALMSEAPTLVHADEHFLHANHFLTCSAAPILDPRGNILGVLDVSGDHRSYHQHTMALVKMSARMIENHWLSDDYRHVMRLHFHSRPEFIGTLMEGILAITPEGRIVGANRGALDQLGLSGAALRMQSLAALFGTSIGALVDRFRSPLAGPLAVTTHNGRPFHVHARFDWPVWSTVAEAVGAVAAPERPASNDLGVLSSVLRPGAPAAPDAAAPEAPARPAPAAAEDRAAVRAEPNGLAQLQTGDAQMQALTAKVQRVLDRDIPILILGETGTGKELLARAIHQDSGRARQPFVAVNCASIPDTLIEAELFGYEEGAFTGARRKGAVGKIVQASSGTLFLDEIGDMPLPLQAHLLRVLQERQVTPLGSSKSVAVDVAIICATHRNLREMIEAKAFREDLYYRLNGLAVRLPPLRERSDLVVLVQRILERECPGRAPGLSADAMALLTAYHWPGNVRQLSNVLRTACVMAGSERLVTREHLPDDFVEDASCCLPATVPQADGAAAAPRTQPLPAVTAQALPSPARSLEDVELDAIRRAVDAAGGNISVAARQLGVSRNTIYRKLRWNTAR